MSLQGDEDPETISLEVCSNNTSRSVARKVASPRAIAVTVSLDTDEDTDADSSTLSNPMERSMKTSRKNVKNGGSAAVGAASAEQVYLTEYETYQNDNDTGEVIIPVVKFDRNCCKDTKNGDMTWRWIFINIFLTAVIGVPLAIFEYVTNPKHGVLRLDDPSIQEKFMETETFPTFSAGFICSFLPAGVLFFTHLGLLRKDYRLPNTWLVVCDVIIKFVFMMIAVLALVDFTKICYGKMRPDFLGRCQVDETQLVSPNPNGLPIYYHIDDICLAEEDIINEGLRAFPSGHAATIFASMVFMVCYLHVRLRHINGTHFWLPVAQTVLIGIAIVVSISRIADHVHAFVDVVFGALFGTIAAFLAIRYLIIFPDKKTLKNEKLEFLCITCNPIESKSFNV